MLCNLQTEQLIGDITVTADKSISHRALILASLAQGQSKIYNLSNAEDVIHNLTALKKLGVAIKYDASKQQANITGLGINGFCQAKKELYMGNSGTAARLFTGLLSASQITTKITGDASLHKRPMDRILQPLSQMGGQFISQNNLLPLIIKPNYYPIPIRYYMKIPSAQIKSALMLAALNIKGTSHIFEPITCRDHSERLFQSFNCKISYKTKPHGKIIAIKGQHLFYGKEISIPGDFSSAAFFIVAALLIPNSRIILRNIGVNPTRIGLLHILKQMGGNIQLKNHKLINNEPICDIYCHYSNLQALKVPAKTAPLLIDEYPILAIAASFAQGTSIFYKLEELKYKESNRLSAIKENLSNNGIECEIIDNNLIIHGKNRKKILDKIKVKTYNDHRIAMSFLILSLIEQKPIEIDNIAIINTSFPDFFNCLKKINVKIHFSDHEDQK